MRFIRSSVRRKEVPNRTICDIFKEMRTCVKTSNFSYLPGLIEEAQTAANRMEAALWDQYDFKRGEERYKELKKKIEDMEEKLGED